MQKDQTELEVTEIGALIYSLLNVVKSFKQLLDTKLWMKKHWLSSFSQFHIEKQMLYLSDVY